MSPDPIDQQCGKVWVVLSENETTQYLALLPGHSQIVSYCRGDQSGSGLGIKLLGTFCTFEVIVKWKQVYWTQFSNLMWCHWCAIFHLSETSYTGHMILYHIDWGACHHSVCTDCCCVLRLHTTRTTLHCNVSAEHMITVLLFMSLQCSWFQSDCWGRCRLEYKQQQLLHRNTHFIWCALVQLWWDQL